MYFVLCTRHTVSLGTLYKKKILVRWYHPIKNWGEKGNQLSYMHYINPLALLLFYAKLH